MKKLSEIKYGETVWNYTFVYSGPWTFADVVRCTGLDRKLVQKVLADLVKHGYIAKVTDSGYMWLIERAENVEAY